MAQWLLMALPATGIAATPGWGSFTAGTWTEWTSPRGSPVAVVFTTTDCEHCPAVIARIRQHIDSLPPPRPLLRVVVTDGGNLTPATAAARWYAMADERRVFEGNELALRYGVSPRWRGETPYVALLSPQAPPRLFAGQPGTADLDTWASRAR